MASLGTNVIANFAGRFWTNLLNLLLIPLYLALLGEEAYALIGFYGTAQAVLMMLDAGLGAAIVRQLARLSGTDDPAPEQYRTLATVECVFLGITAVVALTFFILGPLIAHNWLSAPKGPMLTIEQMQHSVQIMGLVIALQFPNALYHAGLMGLQQQVRANLISTVMGTTRGLGALAVLIYIEPSIELFFWWNVAISGIQAFYLRIWAFRLIGAPKGLPRFTRASLNSIRAFATSMGIGAIVGTAITQFDKIFLSKYLELSEFALYTVANSLAVGVLSIIVPFQSAIFPYFSQLLAQQSAEDPRSIQFYHRMCQIAAVLIYPVCAMLIVFMEPLVYAWIGDREAAAAIAWPARLLVLGTTCYSQALVPAAMQQAWGWPQLTTRTTVVLAPLFVLGNVLATLEWQEVGAAAAWFAYQGSFLIITVLWMHKWMLLGQRLAWLLKDQALPIMAATATTGLLAWAIPIDTQWGRWGIVGYLAVGGCAVLACTALAVPASRNLLRTGKLLL